MIYLLGAISAVFAFWVVVLMRMLIRYALHQIRKMPAPLGGPEFRLDRIALAISSGVLALLLAAFAYVLN